MDISDHVKPTAVAGLREGRSLDGQDTRELLELTRNLGIHLRPIFPVASTPEEAGQYSVHVDEPAKVDAIVQELNNCNAVETAYHVPPVGLP